MLPREPTDTHETAYAQTSHMADPFRNPLSPELQQQIQSHRAALLPNVQPPALGSQGAPAEAMQEGTVAGTQEGLPSATPGVPGPTAVPEATPQAAVAQVAAGSAAPSPVQQHPAVEGTQGPEVAATLEGVPAMQGDPPAATVEGIAAMQGAPLAATQEGSLLVPRELFETARDWLAGQFSTFFRDFQDVPNILRSMEASLSQMADLALAANQAAQPRPRTATEVQAGALATRHTRTAMTRAWGYGPYGRPRVLW